MVRLQQAWLTETAMHATAVRVPLKHPRYPIALAILSRLAVLQSGRFDAKREDEIRAPLGLLLEELIFGAMWLENYMRQIQNECEMGLFAVEQCDAAFAQMRTRDHDVRARMMTAFWTAAHSLFVHCANVSKLMWPERVANSARGRALRTELGIRTKMAISSRDLRNNLEHHDEQIDAWVKEERTNLLDRNIGDLSQMIQPAPDPRDCFRSYDPARCVFGFRGVEVDARALLADLRVIRNAAAEWQAGQRDDFVVPRTR